MRLKIVKTKLKKMKSQKELLVFLAFAFLVFLFYGNTLQNGFVHDDIGQIVQNQYIQSFKYLPKAFTGCIWESVFGGCEGAG